MRTPIHNAHVEQMYLHHADINAAFPEIREFFMLLADEEWGDREVPLTGEPWPLLDVEDEL